MYWGKKRKEVMLIVYHIISYLNDSFAFRIFYLLVVFLKFGTTDFYFWYFICFKCFILNHVHMHNVH